MTGVVLHAMMSKNQVIAVSLGGHPPMQQSKTALATFHATKKNCNAVFCKKCKNPGENNMLHCSFFFDGEKLQVQLWKTASAILSWSGIVVWCYVVCCVWSVGCRPLSVVCCVCPVVAIARRSGTLVGCRGHPYLRQNGFQTHKGSWVTLCTSEA